MSNHIIPKNKSNINHTTYYWFKDGFNDDDIKKIKEYVKDIEFKKGVVFSGYNQSIRDSDIKWIDYNDETKWLYDKIFHYANIANNKIYQFKLHYTSDNIQYSRYSINGKYDFHVDIGSGRNSLRKLSCSILLNDPDEFEGGDFEFQVGKNPEKIPLVKGSVVFFPSFFLHRVCEIKKGTRESLVLWIGGDSYE